MSDELVAVITGASRGLGKGIARALGARGATVYVTGRTRAAGSQVSPSGIPVPGSIDDAAAEVDRAGGRGIPVAVDLADDEQIRALFDEVQRTSGRLDILVNNAAFLHEQMGVRPFWQAPLALATIIDIGLRCHHVATYYAAPLLIQRRGSLVVNISFYGNAHVHDPAYYASKAGLDKLADVYAEHFAPYGVAAVSLWPGYVGTERLRGLLETDPSVRAFAQLGFESPDFVGRVISALYDDPQLLSLSGKTLLTGEVAQRYGVTDLDGSSPRSLREVYGGPQPGVDVPVERHTRP